MPIYEWECGECGERFEELAPAAAVSTTCRACGAGGARRRLSSFAFSRQSTPSQRRRMEDKRGIDRDGARQRFKESLARRRERKPKP